MRSISSTDGHQPIDDRSTPARIRDAAIKCFADNGVADTTVRKIAEAADVSPGLVIHHFGSMDGLRSACDEHVAAVIRQYKSEAMVAGPNLDLLAALRKPGAGSMMGYLAKVLTDGSPTVATLVDDLVDDAETYMRDGVKSGILKPSENPRSRAILLAIWSLGALVLHEHLDRLLGVDLTDPDVLTDPSIAAYLAPIYEIYGSGVLSEAFAERALAAVAEISNGQAQEEPTSPDEESTESVTSTEGTT
jgi:AcrR family transcriptional regulator